MVRRSSLTSADTAAETPAAGKDAATAKIEDEISRMFAGAGVRGEDEDEDEDDGASDAEDKENKKDNADF